MQSAPVNRRQILAFLAALGVSESSLHAQEPTRVDPKNYRVAFENEQLRVLEFRSRPGFGICGVGRHSHPAHLTIALTEAKARVTLEDGKEVIASNKAGDMFWSPAETHSVENIGKSAVHAYIVEIKEAARKST